VKKKKDPIQLVIGKQRENQKNKDSLMVGLWSELKNPKRFINEWANTQQMKVMMKAEETKINSKLTWIITTVFYVKKPCLY
jgi:hypothetical protein